MLSAICCTWSVFWVEYVFVCVGLRLGAVLHGVADTALNLLLIVLRPILIGLITLVEDLTGPSCAWRRASAIQALPDTMDESEAALSVPPRPESILPAASANMPSSYGTRLHTSCPPWQLRVWWSLCAAAWA